MQNSFIIIRFVFFALLVYLNIVALIFTSWNIHVTTSSGGAVPGMAALVIFNACVLFACVAGGLLELIQPTTRIALVKLECGWAAILSVLQIGATVGMTVNSPVLMCQPSDWGVCASAFLVILTTWVGTFTMLVYFVLLFITSVAHMNAYPGIWSTSIYDVPWFLHRPRSHATKSSQTESVESNSDVAGYRDSWGRFWPFSRKDLEAARPTDESSTRAPWSKGLSIRRGIDNPFTKKIDSTSSESSPPGDSLLLSPPDARTKDVALGRPDGSSRYVEVFGESLLPPITQSETLSYYGLTLDGVPPVNDAFPLKVDDHDLPIPLPRLSEWIRADVAKGISVHTVPPISPS